jgi:hypothetical protein
MALADGMSSGLDIPFYQVTSPLGSGVARRPVTTLSEYQQPSSPILLRSQVDAFSAAPFGGNPAAVCLLPRAALPLADALRQQIAAEMNLSETAFVECASDEGGAEGGGGDDFATCARFRLRWFTPRMEVPLCGHATLAAAAALLSGAGNGVPVLRFDTLSGELSVTRRPGGLLEMELPSVAASSDEGALPNGWREIVQARGSLVHCCCAGCCTGGRLARGWGRRAPASAGRLGRLAPFSCFGCPNRVLCVPQAAVGRVQEVEQVLYSPTLRYLTIVLPSSSSTSSSSTPSGGGATGGSGAPQGGQARALLEALAPDVPAMHAAHRGGQLVGVIVTIVGKLWPPPLARPLPTGCAGRRCRCALLPGRPGSVTRSLRPH